MSKGRSIRKREYRLIISIVVLWTVIAAAQLGYDFWTLAAEDCLPPISFIRWLEITELTILIAGLVIGPLIVFLFQKWFRSVAYIKALAYVIGMFTLLFFAISYMSNHLLLSQEMGLGLMDPEVTSEVHNEFRNLYFLPGYFFWLSAVLGTIILLFITDKYGPGNFRKLLLGKYLRPQHEDRIFMFLDLKGSTQIAERLTPETYFNLLKQVFIDITEAILSTDGEIYQYVGDEVVISWPTTTGADKGRCVDCFFRIKKAMLKNREKYVSAFDAAPEFKAGMHCGDVLAGEIGLIKRDITYTGDVLNTTARIESKCNELGSDILISEYLLDQLGKAADRFSPQQVGSILLRGKSTEITLYTLQGEQ